MVLIRRNKGCRINDELRYKGLKTIVMENELLKVTILVDKGTDIIEFLYKPKDVDFMWGHHPCFGDSFLSSDCVINFKSEEIISNKTPISDFPSVKPDATGTLESFPGINGNRVNLSKVLSKEAKVADLLYVTKLIENWFSITDIKKRLGIGFVFDKDIFKYLYLWLVYGGSNNYPWFSNTYSLAIEPWSSYPGLGLLEAIKNKTNLKILPGKIINSWLKVIVFERNKEVKNISNDCCIA